MVSLEDYIKEIEISENYYVMEEGIWQRIKNWFKNLFKSSDDDDYWDWFNGKDKRGFYV